LHSGDKFLELKKAISQIFIPALFDNEYDDNNPKCQLACLPVKYARLAIPYPTISA
jgi:hypothetical protein